MTYEAAAALLGSLPARLLRDIYDRCPEGHVHHTAARVLLSCKIRTFL